jgi:hypothetical protein
MAGVAVVVVVVFVVVFVVVVVVVVVVVLARLSSYCHFELLAFWCYVETRTYHITVCLRILQPVR